MSEMQFFHGYFEESDLLVEPEDTDDFYELEEQHNAHFVKVKGKLYKFWSSGCEVEPYGFSTVVGATEKNQLLLYWYNGGAGVYEVAEEAISNWLARRTQND